MLAVRPFSMLSTTVLDAPIMLPSTEKRSATTAMERSVTTPVFVSRTEVATAVGPAGIFVQDMNADGRPDVITSAFDSDQVTVLINSTGLGGALASFNSFSNTPVGDGPEGVAVGDYNGDGRPDVAAAAKSGSVVSVIRNVTTP